MANAKADAVAEPTLSTDFENSAEVIFEENFVLNDRGQAVVGHSSPPTCFVLDVVFLAADRPFGNCNITRRRHSAHGSKPALLRLPLLQLKRSARLSVLAVVGRVARSQ